MDYLTTAELSEMWGISQRRIAILCKEGRINGAIIKGRTWLIPSETEKPADKRKVPKNVQQNLYNSKLKG